MSSLFKSADRGAKKATVSDSERRLSTTSTLLPGKEAANAEEKKEHQVLAEEVDDEELKVEEPKPKQSTLRKIWTAVKNIEPPEPVLPRGDSLYMPGWVRT